MNVEITDFTEAHLEQAQRIARQNYRTERSFVPALPPIDPIPGLTGLAENGLGVVAIANGEVTGFLGARRPFKNAFGSTDAVGIFSPMGGNGAVGTNRAAVYARMYQVAGEKWADAGASSHAICLYAHDDEAQGQFFRYGFGLRCVDAILDMDAALLPSCPDCGIAVLGPDEFSLTLPLVHRLDAHMAASPCFILRPSDTDESFRKNVERLRPTCVAAKQNGRIVAYVRAERGGENFIADTAGYLHVKSAYCLPEYRGKGVTAALLNMLARQLKTQGYTRLGVDFESINPAAYGFWLKHFAVYTHSVARRIDEHALSKRPGRKTP